MTVSEFDFGTGQRMKGDLAKTFGVFEADLDGFADALLAKIPKVTFCLIPTFTAPAEDHDLHVVRHRILTSFATAAEQAEAILAKSDGAAAMLYGGFMKGALGHLPQLVGRLL